MVPLVPYPPGDGGTIRIFQLATRLARRHSVRLLALDDGSADGEARAALAEMGVALETFPIGRPLFPPRWSPGWWRLKAAGLADPGVAYAQPALRARLDALRRDGEVEVALLETLKMARYGESATGAAILSRQNYEPHLAHRIADTLPPSLDRARWRIAGWQGAGVERRTCRRFRFLSAVSEREAALFRRLAPGAEVEVVPNGVDLERFAPGPDAPGGATVVVSGSMGYLPNRDSALYFHREIWPSVRRACPAARLMVVGDQAARHLPGLAAAPGVELREPGRAIVAALDSAAVIAVPLRAGAGTRIKILEALALGKAVVSTSVGCEGLDAVDGRDLLVADDPEEFARRVAQLLQDAGRRRELGANGRRLVESRYGWGRAAEILEAFCVRVAEQRPGR